MIRTYNLLLAILAVLVSMLWQLPADGGQIFKVEGMRAPGMGQPVSYSAVPFTGWMNVDDGFASLKTAIKFADSPTVFNDDHPIRLNLVDTLPNSLDARIFSGLSNQNTVFMTDPTAGTSFDPLSLTDWNTILLSYENGYYGSVTSAIPVTEPNGVALLAIGAFVLVVACGRAMQATSSKPKRGVFA